MMEKNKLNGNIKQILIGEKEIASEIKKTGEWINSQYSGKPLLFVSILKGGFVFLADLIRSVSIPCEVGFMCAQ
ncbi:MAG: hypoxanthine phosphoribosyltransferase, partial [Oscillospiraceae bacterium]|nr:hypoxanthine phosphoribosyltransferase [Oscillospiraceae bacterium]